jgi:hypothetical protein
VDAELGSFCTTPYVWAQEGDGWLRLDRPRAAVNSYQRALDLLPDSYRRDRGLYTARAAAAHAAAGDPERAATSATVALKMADSTASARIRHEVTAVSRRLMRFRTQSAVAGLFTALASSPSTP